MDRSFYLDLAKSGLRMPIGTDLVLREKGDEEAILLDGARLGAVVVEAAGRYKTPLAVPLMDLTVEKEWLLTILGVPASDIPTYHFHGAPGGDTIAKVAAGLKGLTTPRLRANAGAVAHVAATTDLVPCGMSIGPFSLMTKLIADPIGPVYMSGTGVTGDEDPEVKAVEEALELALMVIERSIAAQIEAGAKVIIVCEPAANLVYLSPKQLAKGSDVFERMVMVPNRRVKAQLAAAGADLFFHDCGELMDEMVGQFATLEPVIMSLGSSRKLWEDAARVPTDIVLFGNLPTKRFYAPDLTIEHVEAMACDLLAKMTQAGHPFILGSECDVLSVPDVRQAITDKVAAFCGCGCG